MKRDFSKVHVYLCLKSNPQIMKAYPQNEEAYPETYTHYPQEINFTHKLFTNARRICARLSVRNQNQQPQEQALFHNFSPIKKDANE